ncbi:MAG: nucleotidyl transferase AbiEii/AbiGii toxin family protein [Anaerolineae bacterium]
MIELARFEDILIHTPSALSPEVLFERSARFGFSQPSEVEAFAWVMELGAQIQGLAGERLVIKGGAATQLYLSLEKQRASVDLDLLSLMNRREVGELLNDVSKRLTPLHPYFIFKEYVPIKPEVALPMQSYFVNVPAALSQVRAEASGPPGRWVKVDFLYLDEPLSICNLSGRSTFALDLVFAPCSVAVGSLIGDKLLTLATESIGIPKGRAADLPKHLYDLDHLTRLPMDESMMRDICQAIQVLVPQESVYRDLQVGIPAVLGHIRRTLDQWAILDLGAVGAEVKGHLSAFQGNYLRADAHLPLYGWAIRALRLKFVLDCVEAALLEGRWSAYQQLRRADELEAAIRAEQLEPRERGRHRHEVREVFLGRFSHLTGLPKRQFKGRAPERIYWQMVNFENLGALEQIVMQGGVTRL